MCLNILRGFRCKIMQYSVLMSLHGDNYSFDLYYLYPHLKISFHVIFMRPSFLEVSATSCCVIWKCSIWEGNWRLYLEGKKYKRILTPWSQSFDRNHMAWVGKEATPGSLYLFFLLGYKVREKKQTWRYSTKVGAAVKFEPCGYQEAGCWEQLADRKDRHSK